LNSFDEAEDVARRYVESKQNNASDSKAFAVQIIDYISSSELKLPLQHEAVISNGTTSYVYSKSNAYPNLFKFISQVLHSEIPITVNDVRFGPGEIIVGRGDQREAEEQLHLSLKELQKLVHAKRAEALRS
jgi:hypothetical protein